MEKVELLKCQSCHGKGYTAVCGFDGNERVNCGNCNGTGTIEFVVTDFEAMEIEVLGMTAEAYNAIAAVETFLGVAPVAPTATAMPMPVHEGMSAQFFDDGVRRAFANDLSISRTATASTVAINSSVDPDVYYSVTATSCTCVGHARVGRCLHRCFALFYWWLAECDAVAEAAHRAAHPVEVEALPIAA